MIVLSGQNQIWYGACPTFVVHHDCCSSPGILPRISTVYNSKKQCQAKNIFPQSAAIWKVNLVKLLPAFNNCGKTSVFGNLCGNLKTCAPSSSGLLTSPVRCAGYRELSLLTSPPPALSWADCVLRVMLFEGHRMRKCRLSRSSIH